VEYSEIELAIESTESVEECVFIVFLVAFSSPSSVVAFEGRMMRSSRIIEDRPDERTIIVSQFE